LDRFNLDGKEGDDILGTMVVKNERVGGLIRNIIGLRLGGV